MDKLKGRIIVRTGKRSYERSQIGKMYKSIGSQGASEAMICGGWSISKGHWRYATEEEIENFNNGIKNIGNIKKCINYEIY